jgi:DNA/RNA-binding domain of Phe-tRNA-synthetase-like protein
LLNIKLCSLEFLLPICVYDYAKIKGEISVKIGTSQDSYLAHNNREMSFQDKFVVYDEIGAFGSPLTDSLRTAVTETTTEVLMIIFAPKDYDSQLLTKQMDIMEGRISHR